MLNKNSLQRKQIIRHKQSIDILFNKGTRINSQFLSFIYYTEHIQNNSNIKFMQSAGIKFIFIVPKKNIKKAVGRNYIKRVLRELVRKSKNEIKIKNDIVLNIALLYKSVQIENFETIKNDYQKLLVKLKTKNDIDF